MFGVALLTVHKECLMNREPESLARQSIDLQFLLADSRQPRLLAQRLQFETAIADVVQIDAVIDQIVRVETVAIIAENSTRKNAAIL